MSKLNMGTIYKSVASDEYYTFSNTILPLIKYIPKDAIVWECAEKINHDGNITKELKNAGIKVITTSIHTGTDFLKCEIPSGITHIITNPPFGLKNEFLKRCYEIGLPFALLLPIEALGTKKRFDLLKQGIEIMVFDKRVKYENAKDSPAFSSCWFCRNILPKQIVFEELK